MHIYPLWEGQSIDNAIEYTINGIRDVIKHYPNKQIAILEAGWATTASEFGERAGESYQKDYYTDLKAWAIENNISVFFFEAFDEPWKGESDAPDAAEKTGGFILKAEPLSLSCNREKHSVCSCFKIANF